MDLSASVLGRNIVSYIVERQKASVLTIGRDAFDRGSLAGVECFNFTAAANLSKLLQSIGVKDTRDLFDNVNPERLVLPRLGAVSLAVLGAAFQAKRIGGATPLAAWFQKHRDGSLVTFASLKHRDDRAVSSPRPRKGRRSRRA